MSGIALATNDPGVKEAVTLALAGPGHACLAKAVDTAQDTLDMCRSMRPEVLVLDVNLAGPDTPRLVAAIMREAPCPILIVATNVSGKAAKVFEALAQGALDAVRAPVLGVKDALTGAEEFLRKLAAVRSAASRLNGQRQTRHRAATNGGRRIVAIGSSTGGPKALADILAGLPADLPAPVVVVQHLDERFADGLADWLASRTQMPVQAAIPDTPFLPGRVYIAKTNDHLVIGSDLLAHYVREPADYPYRPSVDEFFKSLALHWPTPSLAALLTGMGRDGATGLLTLRRAGWTTLAQDEKSSVVYGMPKAAAEIGAAGRILPLTEMAGAIQDYFEEK